MRASSPPPRVCTSMLVPLRTPNPLIPGPRGCLTTPLLADSLPIEPIIEEGRLGTGGIETLPKPLLLPKRDPKAPGERRDGEAMVA